MRRPSFGILLAIVLWATASVHAAHATTIAVTTNTDELNTDGDCSLREAVRAANTNAAVDACPAGQNDQTDTITVPAGTYTLTIAGDDDAAASGDLDLLNNAADLDLVINGAGAATTIIEACAVDQRSATCPVGQGVFDRVLHVRAKVQISGVTVRHGRPPRVNIRRGGGIYVDGYNNTGADLTLTDVVVTKNGIVNSDIEIQGGGIANEYGGKLTLVRTTVSDNAGSGQGDYTGGGGIYNGASDTSVLVMTDSTVSGNTTNGTAGAGIWNSLGGQATLTGCTISGNVGGGIGNSGHLVVSTMTLTNCTVSGNQSTGNAGGISNSGKLYLRSSTVTLNRRRVGPSAEGAGGIYGTALTVLRNTIVAGNIHDEMVSAYHPPDCDDISAGTNVVSEGFSLVGDGKRCKGLVDSVNGDQIGTEGAVIDAKLGPLADNGGPTLTHILLPDSLALDAANPATPGSGGNACPATDQRGEPRPSGIACDVGAVELDAGSGGPIAVQSVQPAVGGNAGTAYTRALGSGFQSGAVVKLVRSGFPDVVGTTADVRASAIVSNLDLTGVAPGVWSVRVENPDATFATLTDAYTVVAGGGPDLWSTLVVPRSFFLGRTATIYLQFGNRGLNDARAVPLWLSFPDELDFHIPFAVSAPPTQPGQIATDWSRIAIDAPIPPPENRDSFPFLLPIVPAGSTRTLRIRVTSPLAPIDPSRTPFRITADIGTPYLQPDLSPAIVAGYVARAKEYATTAFGPIPFPSDASIEQYVRTQLANVVAEGTVDTLANLGGDPPLYSQTQLLVDTGQFIGGESATAASSRNVSWLARLVTDLVGGAAEARLIEPDCDPQDVLCEREVSTCEDDPHLCTDPPVIKCDKLTRIDDTYIFVPCKPHDTNDVPFRNSFDPNDKIGPNGDDGFIDGVAPLPYTILFENKSTASGDAFEVTVTDQLDTAKYDLTTFSLGPISFGSTFVPVPPGLKSYTTEVDLRPAKNILVGIDAALDVNTGVATWKFTTLDPATHQFPENPDVGFLPPNVTQPEGEGAVLFTVKLKPGFPLGTTVCNDARIVFDFNAPIDTPEFCNTIGQPEDCENCVDDDGDGLVDRADPDCTEPANGGGAGAGDGSGKAVDACGKAIRKVGAKLTSDRLKRLGACEKAVADCVQLKPGDAACLTKARSTCAKARAGFPAVEAKGTAAIVKACAEPGVAEANLLAAAGLGFAGEAAPCETRGLASVSTAADVAECVSRQHACGAARAFGAAVPRARELLILGGFDPATDLGCLAPGANGGGTALAPEKRKAIRKCDAAVQKAATKLLAGRTKAVEACDAAVFTCLQTKPGDASCVTKAGGTCTKAIAGLPKLTASFDAAIAKACGAGPLVPADLLGADGLGASALAARCKALGVMSLETVDDVSTCLAKEVTCQTDTLLESATPRLGELLGLGGVALP